MFDSEFAPTLLIRLITSDAELARLNEQFRHKTGTPGRVSVFAVYCRNDQPMSQTTAWTEASGPDDPRLGAMFSALFQVLFVEVNPNRPMPTFLSPM